jgi:multiple sugar transport system permease protein
MADATTGFPAAALSTRTSALHRLARRRSSIAFAMCIPLFALILGMVVYPFFYSIYLSMLSRDMSRFIGLFNYEYLLTSETFHLVIFQSCLFAVTAVFFKAVIGFILAHVMHNIHGRD